MPQELTTIATTFGNDRVLTLANGEAIRSPIYTSNWTRVRIGLHGNFTDSGSGVIGQPRLAFGVCRGDVNGYGAALSDHVVGAITGHATWTRNAGPPTYYAFPARMLRAFTKVGATLTEGVDTAGISSFSSGSNRFAVTIIEILKGSPNYTISVICPVGNGSQTDVDPVDFIAAMEASDMATAVTALPALYTEYVASTTLAVDEGANGLLDYIFIYWDRTAVKFNFNIRHRKVA